MRKELIWVGIFLILTIPCYAIGLRSSTLNNDIHFEPYFEGTYYYSIMTTSSDPMDVQVYVRDDDPTLNLSKYFTPSVAFFKQLPPDSEPTFSIHVKLPSEIKIPGTHRVYVGVIELPKSKGGFTIRTAVESIFFVRVPFNGQYVQYGLNAQNVNAGQDIPFTLTLLNLGSDEIRSAYADIEIFDVNNKSTAKVKTSEISIASQEQKEILTNVPSANMFAGPYVAQATIHYDGKEVTTATDFKLGQLTLNILNQTESIVAGKINEFTVTTESQWAENIDDVYAEISIAGKPLIRTLPVSLGGFQQATLHGFFDATGLDPGTYDAVITLHFADKTISKKVQVTVTKESLFSMPSLQISLSSVLLTTILIIILIINITLFIIMMKRKDDHDKERN